MKNTIKYLLLIVIFGCNTRNINDKKTASISFDFVDFDEKKFKQLLNDTTTAAFADTLLNQVREEKCLKIIKITNASDSSIWVFYFNWHLPQLFPERIINYTIDSANHAQVQGDALGELFGAKIIEIKPKSNKSFLTCPSLQREYDYYEMNFSYSKKKNVDTYDKYVLKCRIKGDSLIKIE